jgi:hypothetical protein
MTRNLRSFNTGDNKGPDDKEPSSQRKGGLFSGRQDQSKDQHQHRRGHHRGEG